jgi:hypothetical protein
MGGIERRRLARILPAHGQILLRFRQELLRHPSVKQSGRDLKGMQMKSIEKAKFLVVLAAFGLGLGLSGCEQREAGTSGDSGAANSESGGTNPAGTAADDRTGSGTAGTAGSGSGSGSGY